ncbi:MAG: type II toxin-antitoxin system Phd/YefM family antitoxin [Gammaproteobacteria bacterium]|nr:type II toxin-antitoxin system Phd/YefM family antitoxin [Gammaproteobacteria bacterium]
MRSVGIDALKRRLREYVRLAASGETILVTDRDRVVAELGPPPETKSAIIADPLLAGLVRGGVLTPPVLSASGRPRKPPPVARLDDLLAELDEARCDRLPGAGQPRG